MKPIIKRLPRNSENGSCSYCQRSTLKQDRMGLDYPYEEIVRVEGTHVVTNFCPECWETLLNSPEAIETTEIAQPKAAAVEDFGFDIEGGITEMFKKER